MHALAANDGGHIRAVMLSARYFFLLFGRYWIVKAVRGHGPVGES
jgi:hypothetical protein